MHYFYLCFIFLFLCIIFPGAMAQHELDDEVDEEVITIMDLYKEWTEILGLGFKLNNIVAGLNDDVVVEIEWEKTIPLAGPEPRATSFYRFTALDYGLSRQKI
jgi:hypothetical protein